MYLDKLYGDFGYKKRLISAFLKKICIFAQICQKFYHNENSFIMGDCRHHRLQRRDIHRLQEGNSN